MTMRFAALPALIAVVASIASPAWAETHCPIRIGGIAPLSAPGAVIAGEAMRVAMLIAERDINAAGGVLGCKVQVVIGDSKGGPETGAAIMEWLITQEKVVAVGGTYHSSVGVASKGIAEAAGIPVVYAETWNDTITGDKHKYIFRIAPLSSWASASNWQFAMTLPGVKTVAIVTENTDYGTPAAAETAAGLLANGIASQTFSADLGTQDFSGIIERIKAMDPDYIMVLSTGEAVYHFTQQAADAGIGPQDLPFQTGQEALESKTYWQQVPDGNLAFVQRVGTPPALWNAKAIAVNAAYLAETGKGTMESYAFEAYDSIAVLAQAINEAGSTDGDAIVAALEAIRHEGTLGTIYFPYGSQKDPSVDGKGAEWWHQWPDVALTVVQYQAEGQEATSAPIVWPEFYKTGEAIHVAR